MFSRKQQNRLALEQMLSIEDASKFWARERIGSLTKLSRLHHVVAHSADSAGRSVRVWYLKDSDLQYPQGDCPIGAKWIAGIELGKETPEAYPYLTADKYKEVAKESDLARKYQELAGPSQAAKMTQATQ